MSRNTCLMLNSRCYKRNGFYWLFFRNFAVHVHAYSIVKNDTGSFWSNKFLCYGHGGILAWCLCVECFVVTTVLCSMFDVWCVHSMCFLFRQILILCSHLGKQKREGSEKDNGVSESVPQSQITHILNVWENLPAHVATQHRHEDTKQKRKSSKHGNN